MDWRMTKVAPFTGAWIEIKVASIHYLLFLMSLPSRGRGLKYNSINGRKNLNIVAPFTGAWIEIEVRV